MCTLVVNKNCSARAAQGVQQCIASGVSVQSGLCLVAVIFTWPLFESDLYVNLA